MKTAIRIFFLVIVLFLFAEGAELIAQCPMCKMSAESNLENGGDEAAGLNKGILYLFVMPYLLIGTFAYLWIKNKKDPSEL